MGLVKATIILRNPKEDEIKEMEVEALVDSGALHLCIPEKVAIQLNLKELYKRDVTTADGKEYLCPYVGPIEVKFENRGCFTGAIILGDEILLGAVPMEDMDVLISPAQRKLIVNPKSPNIASSIVKGFKK
ncbi:MAG: clan AA aspartic protease [Candidatus Stahlbacteria bacterium]|nr:clan AA aspartic protease [Candidatus Stahlbacteria bacterium]